MQWHLYSAYLGPQDDEALQGTLPDRRRAHGENDALRSRIASRKSYCRAAYLNGIAEGNGDLRRYVLECGKYTDWQHLCNLLARIDGVIRNDRHLVGAGPPVTRASGCQKTGSSFLLSFCVPISQ